MQQAKVPDALQVGACYVTFITRASNAREVINCCVLQWRLGFQSAGLRVACVSYFHLNPPAMAFRLFDVQLEVL